MKTLFHNLMNWWFGPKESIEDWYHAEYMQAPIKGDEK